MPDDQVNVEVITQTKKSIAGLAKLAGGIFVAKKAFDLMLKVSQESVEAFRLQENVNIKLEAALKATSGAVGISAREMQKMSESLDTLTQESDETITATQGILVTFTNIGEKVFPQALEAALDLSTMFGTGLKESAIQLGKALNDPIAGISALSRIGIVFTQEQKDLARALAETGDIAGAQAVILDELNREFGGVALAAGQLATAGLDAYTDAMTDLKEVTGETIVKAIGPVAGALAKMIQKFADSTKEARLFKEALERFEEVGVPEEIDDMAVTMEALQKELKDNAFWQKIGVRELENYLGGTKASEEAVEAYNKELISQEGILKRQIATLTLQIGITEVRNKRQKELSETERKAAEEKLKNDKIALALQTDIQEAYATTHAGEVEALEASIARWEQVQSNMQDADDDFANRHLPLLAEIIATEKEELAALLETDEVVQGLIDTEAERFARAKEFHKVKVQLNEEEKENLKEMMELQRMAAENFLVLNENALAAVSAASGAYYNSRLVSIDNDIMAEQERLEQLKEIHDEEKANLKEQLEQGLISQTAYDESVQALDKNLVQAQGEGLEALEEKRKEILTSQAKADKAAAIVGAIVNTALGITKAIAQTGVLAPLFTAIVAAAGAAQIAAIVATPIPSFATGGDFVTHGPQAILVGDNPSGRERVTVEPLGGGNGGNDRVPLYATFNIDSRTVFRWLTEASRAKNFRTYRGSLVD